MFYSLWLVKTTGKLWHRQFGEIYFDFFFQFMISVHRKAHVSFWHLRNDFQTRKRCKSHTRFETIARESEDLSLIKKGALPIPGNNCKSIQWKIIHTYIGQVLACTFYTISYYQRASLNLFFTLKIAIIHCCNSFKSN